MMAKDQAPSSVRDQIFDHQSDTVRYYLDREVRFNTQAAFVDRPSNELVQKLARRMTLTADPTAPTRLSAEMSTKLNINKIVVRLRQRNRALTKKLRDKYRFVRLVPPDDPRLQDKKSICAALRREKSNRRNRILEKARRRHVRTAETVTLEAQFAEPVIACNKNTELMTVPNYEIPSDV